MGQYCFACWRLLSVVAVCNAAGRAGWPAAGRVGGRAAADTARSVTATPFLPLP